MTVTQSYHSILVLDIEQSSLSPNDQVLVRLQEGLRGVLDQAVTNVGIDAGLWEATTSGDGLLAVFSPVVPTAQVVRLLLDHVSAELEQHNRLTAPVARIRARAVVHAGQVLRNPRGIIGQEVTLAFRLLNSDALRAELTRAPGPLVAAVSEAVYRQVVQQGALGLDPDTFRPVQAQTKETSAAMWVHRPASGSRADRSGEVPGSRRPWRRHLGKLLGLTVLAAAVVGVLAALDSGDPQADARAGNEADGTPGAGAPGTAGPPAPTEPAPAGATGCGDRFTHVMTNGSVEVRNCADWAPGSHIPVHEDPSPDSPVLGRIRQADEDWYACQRAGERYELDGYGYQSRWWASTLTDDVPHRWGYVSEVYFRGGENGEREARLEPC